MKFFKTPLDGAYIIELEKLEDNRGFFQDYIVLKNLIITTLITLLCK